MIFVPWLLRATTGQRRGFQRATPLRLADAEISKSYTVKLLLPALGALAALRHLDQRDQKSCDSIIHHDVNPLTSEKPRDCKGFGVGEIVISKFRCPLPAFARDQEIGVRREDAEAQAGGPAVRVSNAQEERSMTRTHITGATMIAIVLALLMPTEVLAQQQRETFRDAFGRTFGWSTSNGRGGTTYYDAAGRNTGRSVTDSQGSTTFYDASGRVTGRSSTGSNRTTTIYDASGRRTGTVTQSGRK